MTSTPPTDDEIEISVFGRGLGEAICLHMGSGEWACIDSCIDPDTAEPAALSYLTKIGVDPTRSLSIVVATHWHDDHVKGIADIVERCAGAVVVLSAAVHQKEFVAYLYEQEAARGALGSGVDQLRRVLELLAARGVAPIWAKANVPLHPRPPGDAPRLVALSPSDDAFDRFLQSLIARTHGATSPGHKRRAPPSQNGASVAAWFRNEIVNVLLGADLERTANADDGWDAVLKYCKPTVRASVFKVPHHGSKNAHHESVWSDVMEVGPLALLTPWVRGGKVLPTEEDIARIIALTGEAYITALPQNLLTAKKVEAAVRRELTHKIRKVRGWGHIRARRRTSEAGWRIELAGTAVRLTP